MNELSSESSNHSSNSDTESEIAKPAQKIQAFIPLSENQHNEVTRLFIVLGIKAEVRIWRNYNGNIQQPNAFVVSLTDLDVVNTLYREVYKLNQSRDRKKEPAIDIVAVGGGWDKKPIPWYKQPLGFCSANVRTQIIDKEYSEHSYTLNPITSARGAHIIIQISERAQSLKVVKRKVKGEEKVYAIVTPGVRLIDAHKRLHKKGYALPANYPTLHVATIGGLIEQGCYGPKTGDPAFGDNVDQVEIVDPLGGKRFLSDNGEYYQKLNEEGVPSGGLIFKADPHILDVYKGGTSGTSGFVKKIRLKNLRKPFYMQRTVKHYADAKDLKANFLDKSLLNHEHAMVMYIPTPKRYGLPRFQSVSAFELATPPKKKKPCCDLPNMETFLHLLTTELGEPFIQTIAESKTLHRFMKYVLMFAAKSRFGKIGEEQVDVDLSWKVLHILDTYTDIEIVDINWLLHVDAKQVPKVAAAVFSAIDKKINELSKAKKYPLLNAFLRILKGKSGEHQGISTTATNDSDQYVLAFELLTFKGLSQTDEFRELVAIVDKVRKEFNIPLRLHLAKHLPEGVNTLRQILTDQRGKKGLKEYQDYVTHMHHDTNLDDSTVLTPLRKHFFGLGSTPKLEPTHHQRCTTKACVSEQEALNGFLHFVTSREDTEVNQRICRKLKAQSQSLKEEGPSNQLEIS